MAAPVPLTLGPYTPDVKRDNGNLVEIKLPYDLRPMGIPHILTQTNLLNNAFTNRLYKSITDIPDRDCTFFAKQVHGGIRLNNNQNVFDTSITIDGVIYNGGEHVGSGVSGFVYKFKTGASARHTVCLKFQLLETDDSINTFIKEGIIHHILYESTKYNTHTDCQYVPEFKKISRIKMKLQDLYGYSSRTYNFGIYIVQLCEGDYDSISNKKKTNEYAIMQISRKLDRLWELYKFNHCDFHAKNSLYINDSVGNIGFLLNDFGYSAITLKEYGTAKKLSINTKSYIQRESRDLTHLIAYLRKFKDSFKSIGNSYDIGTRILSNKLYKDLETLANTTYQYRGVPHFVVYDWMDNLANDNPSGNPLTYVETYNTAVNPIIDSGGCIPAKIAWVGAVPPPAPGAPPVPPPAVALNAPARAVVAILNAAAATYTRDRTDANASAWINAFRALCTYTKNNPNQTLYIEVYNSLQTIISESERAGSPLNNSIGRTVAQIKAGIQTKLADLGRVNPQRAQFERTAAATYKGSPTNPNKSEWIQKFVEVKQQLGQRGADERLAKAVLFAQQDIYKEAVKGGPMGIHLDTFKQMIGDQIVSRNDPDPTKDTKEVILRSIVFGSIVSPIPPPDMSLVKTEIQTIFDNLLQLTRPPVVPQAPPAAHQRARSPAPRGVNPTGPAPPPPGFILGRQIRVGIQGIIFEYIPAPQAAPAPPAAESQPPRGQQAWEAAGQLAHGLGEVARGAVRLGVITAAEAIAQIRANPIQGGITVAAVGIFAMFHLRHQEEPQQGGIYQLTQLQKNRYTRRRSKKLSRRKKQKKSRRYGRR